MKRSGLWGVLALMMVFLLFPAKANAAAATYVLIGTVRLDAANPSTTAYGGTASFRTENGEAILTLNNVNDSSGAYYDYWSLAFIKAEGDLTLELIGSNSVLGPTRYDSYGIRVESGTLTVTGSGSLVSESGTPTGSSSASAGVFATGAVSIMSGSLTAIGKPAANMSVGIYSSSTSISGGSLTASGDKAAIAGTVTPNYPGGRYLWKASATTVLPAAYTDSNVTPYSAGAYRSVAFAPFSAAPCPNDGADIPKTGDAALPALWAGLLTVSLGGALIRRKRRPARQSSR